MHYSILRTSVNDNDNNNEDKENTMKKQQRILVFLDIDGVLLPFPTTVAAHQSTCGAIFPDPTLAALSRILDAFSGDTPSQSSHAVTKQPELILSSTWRAQENLIAEILHSFELYGKAHGGPLQSIQAFDDMTDPEYHSERQYEIHKYLLKLLDGEDTKNNDYSSSRGDCRDHQPSVAWVALDDEELLEGASNAEHRSNFIGHAVKVNSRIGLTDDDAAFAIDLLQQQL